MSSAGPAATSAAPTWANTTGPARPAVEDHRGTADRGMDELLAPVSTLDEPVKETIMRDVRAVGAKLRAVMIPLDRNVSLVYANHFDMTDIIRCMLPLLVYAPCTMADNLRMPAVDGLLHFNCEFLSVTHSNQSFE